VLNLQLLPPPPRRTNAAQSDGPAGLRPAGGDSSSHVPPRQTLETLSEPQQPLDPQAGRTVPKYSSLNTAAPMSLIEKLRLQADPSVVLPVDTQTASSSGDLTESRLNKMSYADRLTNQDHSRPGVPAGFVWKSRNDPREYIKHGMEVVEHNGMSFY
jgi:hypothetical protein